NGLRIHEVAVDWIEDVDSKVAVARTAMGNLRGLARTANAIAGGAAELGLPPRPALRPAHPAAAVRAEGRRAPLPPVAPIRAAATVAHAAAYYLLRAWWQPEWANLAALLLTCFANTEANRRWAFRYRTGPRGRRGVHARAALVFVVTYLITSIAVVGMPETGR